MSDREPPSPPHPRGHRPEDDPVGCVEASLWEVAGAGPAGREAALTHGLRAVRELQRRQRQAERDQRRRWAATELPMACSCAPQDRAALEAMMTDAARRLRCTRADVVDEAVRSLAHVFGVTRLEMVTDQWSVVVAERAYRRRLPVRVQCDEVGCGIVRLWLHFADHPPVHATAVQPLGGHRVRVVFDDEATVERDLTPLLTGPVFGAISASPAEFAHVTIDADRGVLCWPNEADIDADLLRYDDLWAEATNSDSDGNSE